MLASPALSATEAATDQQSVAEIPVADEGNEPPPAPDFQWNIIGDVQGDALAATSVPSGDRDSPILRRARFSGVGDWRFDWRLRLSGDLGKFRGLRDASIEYRGFPIYLALGRMIEPFGLLQGGASSAAFMERPQPMQLAPGYGEGFAASAAGEHWGFSAGAFDATQNEIDLGRRKERAYTARLTWVPRLTETDVLHVGVAGSRRFSGGGLQEFDTIPESALLREFDIKSGIGEIDQGTTNAYWLYGGELAGRKGPLLFESEYILAASDDEGTRGPTGLIAIAPPRYKGYYAELSWTVTGEQRDYSVRHGTFGNVFPSRPFGQGRIGAIEVAARYSDTNLRFALPYHGPFGDRGSIYSVGLNWYPSDTIRVMLEALQLKQLKDKNGVSEKTEQWLVQTRLQWYFRWP